MLKNVRGCVTSSGTVDSTSAMLLLTGRTLGGRRAPACSATPTAGTWTQTWSTGGTGRCLNTKGKVVTAEVETPLVSECEDQALRLNLLQFDFIAALSVAV